MTSMTQYESLKPLWTPKDYQKRALKLLLQQACLGLILDPGLGKTSISLGAFNVLKKQKIAKRMLVIAPLRPAYSTWPGEISKWRDFEGLTYCILHGPDKEEKLDLDADIFIINPEAVGWLCQDFRWKKINADILCVDESTKFKNSQTVRFKALRGLISRFRRRWILTGTPAPNGLLDLFGQIYILDEGLALGRFITHYKNKYFVPSGYGGYEFRPQIGAADAIADRIKEITLRMSAEEFLQMPELIYQNIDVALPPAAYQQYKTMEDDFLLLFGEDDAVLAPNAAVAGGKCRQIANGALYTGAQGVQMGPQVQGAPYLLLHDAKIDALRDLVEQLQGNPLLVAYEFQHDAQRIVDALGKDTPVIGGGTSASRSNSYIEGFNRGDIQVLVGHPASMGHGLNLQEVCHHVCWFGIPWNLEHYDQLIRRVYRQGQKERVFVYHIVAKDTLDESVLKTLAAKDRTQRDLLGKIQSVKSACIS